MWQCRCVRTLAMAIKNQASRSLFNEARAYLTSAQTQLLTPKSSRIRILDLCNNRLSKLSGNIAHLQNLEFLFLDNNHVQ